MPTISLAVGAVTATSARVKARVSGAAVALAVADNEALTAPVLSAPQSPSSDDMCDFNVGGFDPNTRYWYALEIDGVLDTAIKGTFQTFPVAGQPASFTFAASSCARGTNQPHIDSTTFISNHTVFDTIRNSDALFFVHQGDIHYRDIGSDRTPSTTLATFRTAYNDVWSASRQHQLYREMPLVYTWDDHDFGPNNSDRTFVGKANAAAAYRERVPSYGLATGADGGIYHSFTVGRVLFIASDTRYYRDPNDDPDGAGKTMLGSGQRAWMEGLLTTTEAEALVWLCPTPWIGLTEDTFAGFTHERDQLVEMFQDLGWADRMVTLNGDYHGLAMDSGGQPYGGFPIYLFCSMDSFDDDLLPGGGSNQYDMGTTKPGSNQWGTVAVVDTGDAISITGTGYTGDTAWRQHTFEISTTVTPPPPPPPDPVPEQPPGVPQSLASPATRVTWYGCDLVTGRVIAELPDITGTISRVLGASTSSSLSMPIPLSGLGSLGDVAFQATEPGRTMLVAVVNNVPSWAGIILTRIGGSEATLQLGCVSLEGYLDRRYVHNHNWVQQDEVSVIAAGLISDAQLEGIGLGVDAEPTGVLRDRKYSGIDDAMVYSRLTELMGVEGGPEWTIDVDWADENLRTVVAKTVRIRPRIGIASDQPGAVFESTSTADTTYNLVEDYSDGRGANHVIARSSGEGDDRPTSATQTGVDPGWPRYERRFSPSTTISETATLTSHAVAELALRRYGSRVFQLSARWDATPRLNLDWRLGDDVAWILKGHRHPNGVTGQGRVIGWELDMAASLVKPILLVPGETV